MVTPVFLNNCVAEGDFGPGTILRRITYHRKSRDEYSLNLYHTYSLAVRGLEEHRGGYDTFLSTDIRFWRDFFIIYKPIGALPGRNNVLTMVWYVLQII
jgi:hypothetical protein